MTQLYELDYDRTPFWRWDHLGLTACQKANYGNARNWFYPFRSGLNGFHSRMSGAAHHYQMIYAWLPQARWPKEFEYHISTFFFHADSALECLTFALNSLGYGIFGDGFLSVSDERSLRQISPNLMLDGLGGRRAPASATGFNRVFSKTKALWRSNISLIELVFEQHDVSKHRHTIYDGGSMRTDAPAGFWDLVQVEESDRPRFFPMKEVILGNDLRKPLEKRRHQEIEEWVYLEDIAAEFFDFISKTGHSILEDSTINIPIKVPLAANALDG